MAGSGSTSLNDNDVFRARLARARDEMARQDVDFLFITPSSDMTYMLGYPAHESERLTLLGVPREGEPFVVVPTLEAVRLESRRDIVDVHRWEETESPTDLVARLVEGAAGARVGVSDRTWAVFLMRLQDAMPETRFTSGNDVLRQLRMHKDAAEIELMRVAGERTDRAYNRFVVEETVTGKTEQQIADAIGRLMLEEGMQNVEFAIVGSGPNGASPHHMTSDRVVQPGDAIVMDFGASWQHYKSDITRTVFVGEPTAKFREVYETALAANAAAHAAARPGVACEDIDKAARDVIEAAGYGEYFIHRVGHGLGLDVHEEPYMVGGNTLPLAEGMVFSDEPGIYIPGEFGVRIEDILVCTADGAESFNQTARRDLISMA